MNSKEFEGKIPVDEVKAIPPQPELVRIANGLAILVNTHEQIMFATNEKLNMIKHCGEVIDNTSKPEKSTKSVVEEMHYLLDRLEKSIRTAEANLNHLSEIV